MAEPVATPSLTRTIVSLRWKLFLRSFRKNWGLIIGTIIGALYGIGGLVFLGSVLAGAIFAPEEFGGFPAVIRSAGLLLMLTWFAVPLISFGLDDTLGPQKFAALGRPTKALLRPIFLASFIGLPAALTAIGVTMAIIAQAAWLIMAMTGAAPAAGINTPGAIASLIALIPMNALAIALAITLPRTILSWRANWRLSRRTTELIRGIALVLALGVAYSFSALMSSSAGIIDVFFDAAAVALPILMWTPFGAPFSVAMDLAQGQWLVAAGRALITIATMVVAWKLWSHFFELGRLQALQGAAQDKGAKVTALVPRWLPNNALGAVAGKSLRYWRRDSRYSMALAIMPVVVAFFIAMSLLNRDSGFMGYVAIAITAWMGGITISNEIGFDGPSTWVNIVAGVNNRANLVGRYLAFGTMLVPFLLLLCIVVPILSGQPDLIIITIGAAFGFLFSSWGISIFVTAYFPYPAPRPGSMKSSSAGTAWISMLTAFIGTWIPMLPAIGLLIAGFVFVPGLEYAGAALALAIGATTLVVCLKLAVKRLDRRYPEAFQATKAFAS